MRACSPLGAASAKSFTVGAASAKSFTGSAKGVLSKLLSLPSRLYHRVCIAEHLMQVSHINVPPEWVKHAYIRDWAQHTGYKVLVETGTYRGNTTMAVADAFKEVHTIEYDRGLYEAAVKLMKDRTNIKLYHGDSAVVIRDILRALNEPAIFWLDAHYCGGVTAKSPKDPPIRDELAAIFAHPIASHAILIDDARAFTGFANYPTIKQIVQYVSAASPYQVRVFRDIIHIYREMT
jgi:hypothetical protein